MLRLCGILVAALLLGGGAEAATVRIGLPSFPPSNADPFDATARASLLSTRAVYDTLAELGLDLRPRPALAASWRNVDPNTWVVTLKPGITFSNGEPLSADAVVVSYMFPKSPEARTLITAAEVQNIASVRAIDKLTVEFKTTNPDPAFTRRMAIIPIVPPAYWKKVGHAGFVKAPVGTGPFIVENWTTARVTLTAFKNSWRAPRTDRLEILNLPLVTARIQALMSNRIDIASDVGPDNIETLMRNGYAIYQRPVSAVDVMALNTLLPNSPFKDVRVRQALNYAIDRQGIASTILHDRVPPASQPAARANPDYDPEIKAYPFDPKKAKALLAEAGYPNGFAFTYEMNNAGGADMAAIMEQVARNLSQVGVRMEIRPVPWPQIVRNVRQGTWQAEAFGLEYEVLPTGDTLWPYRLHSCAWTHPWYCDDAVMPLIAEAKSTFDDNRRRDVVRKILDRTQEQAASVLLFEPAGLDGLSPKVMNYQEVFGTIGYERLTLRP